MEMSYNGALVMPGNYAVVSNEEMEYIDGGWSHTITETLGSAARRLSKIVTACVVGNVLSIALGVVGEWACKIIGAACGAWFTNILSKADTAHNKAELLIKQYGKNRKCEMTSTWAIVWCTGMSLSLC